MAGAFIVEPPICVLKIDGQKIVLSHYPMADWQGMNHGSWHLHGHIHSSGGAYNEFNRKQGLLRHDVGVDANDYAPVSLDAPATLFCSFTTSVMVMRPSPFTSPVTTMVTEAVLLTATMPVPTRPLVTFLLPSYTA